MRSNGEQVGTGSGTTRAGALDALLALFPGTAAEGDCVDTIVDLQAAISQLQARQETELARANYLNGVIDFENGHVTSPVADELAPRLSISPGSADHRLTRAAKMCDLTPGVHAAFVSGDLPSMAHVMKYLEGLGPVKEPDIIAKIERHVLPRVKGKTPAKVCNLVKFAVALFDTVEETQRFDEARADRGVSLFHKPYGMSELTLHIRSEHAQWIQDLLHKAARRLLADPDVNELHDTKIQALMADLAVLTFLNAANRWPGTTPNPEPADGPEVPGLCDVPADTIDDHIAAAASAVAAQAAIVLDLPTALGMADNPGELRGCGPVPGPVARDIARHSATWRAWLTDPATKELIGLGRKSYPPSWLLTDFLQSRDRRCRFPGCPRLADKSDKDHVINFAEGGTTDPWNMQCLCRRHHNEKTTGRWKAVMNEAAHVLWTSPQGHEYRTQPDTPLDAQPAPPPEPEPPPETPPF